MSASRSDTTAASWSWNWQYDARPSGRAAAAESLHRRERRFGRRSPAYRPDVDSPTPSNDQVSSAIGTSQGRIEPAGRLVSAPKSVDAGSKSNGWARRMAEARVSRNRCATRLRVVGNRSRSRAPPAPRPRTQPCPPPPRAGRGRSRSGGTTLRRPCTSDRTRRRRRCRGRAPRDAGPGVRGRADHEQVQAGPGRRVRGDRLADREHAVTLGRCHAARPATGRRRPGARPPGPCGPRPAPISPRREWLRQPGRTASPDTTPDPIARPSRFRPSWLASCSSRRSSAVSTRPFQNATCGMPWSTNAVSSVSSP